jgi:HTH-type transcriptional regulator / antitoxin HigA
MVISIGNQCRVTTPTAPSTAAILNAWLPFKAAMGVVSVHTKAQYAQACVTLEALLNEVGDNEKHPLADVLDYLSDQVAAYEQEHVKIPVAAPREVLRFLIEQHNLKQDELSDCAPQSRISEILAGKREISKAMALRFAGRFGIPVSVFLG